MFLNSIFGFIIVRFSNFLLLHYRLPLFDWWHGNTLLWLFFCIFYKKMLPKASLRSTERTENALLYRLSSRLSAKASLPNPDSSLRLPGRWVGCHHSRRISLHCLSPVAACLPVKITESLKLELCIKPPVTFFDGLSVFSHYIYICIYNIYADFMFYMKCSIFVYQLCVLLLMILSSPKST